MYLLQALKRNKKFFFISLYILSLAACALLLYRYTRANENTRSAREKSLIYSLPSVEDHYKLKQDGATVTLVNYFSMDCPHCRVAFLDEDKILRDNKATGKKINIIYRHNPLASQPLSYEKALISECVYKQSSDIGFFEFIRDVYIKYNSHQDNNQWVKKIAYEHITSKENFNSCLNDKNIQDKVQNQKNGNIIADISYTPTILIFEGTTFIKKYENIGESMATLVLTYYLGITR